MGVPRHTLWLRLRSIIDQISQKVFIVTDESKFQISQACQRLCTSKSHRSFAAFAECTVGAVNSCCRA